MTQDTPVTLVNRYDPAWPVLFDQLKAKLERVMGDLSCAIEHVGSTAVPGLVAKPIIDIDVVVRESELAASVERLATIGYRHQGDLGIAGRHAFDIEDQTLKTTLPAHHLYVCFSGGVELRKHLLFRDFMRQNSAQVTALSALKWALCLDSGNDRVAYMNGKSRFYEDVLAQAAASPTTGT